MRLCWGENEWVSHGVPGAAPAAENALVVDSFLLRDGRVRDLERHQERFAHSCAALGLAVDRDRLTRFLEAAAEALPPEGRWFPRLEAHAGNPVDLVCWIRPAPPLAGAARLWVYPEPDPRSRPRIKGPDLTLLAELRAQAREHDADDAVLLNSDGVVLETAHSALLWWRDDMLCYPDPNLPLLPSITASRVLAQAQAAGFAVRATRCRWTELTDLEVWAVNALHGIRPVISWRSFGRDVLPPPTDVTRLNRFRSGDSGLDDLREIGVDERNGPSTP